MKSKNLQRFAALVSGALWLAAAAALPAATLHVYAAASLSDSLKSMAVAYEKESGDKVVFNLGASSLLARQIEAGAPADIFFSADEARMDGLAKKNLLLGDTRRKLLGNTLVVVVALDSKMRITSAGDLRQARRLALAEPRTVPAGIYAKEYLMKKNLWAELESRVVPTDNVRAALAAVESGNVAAGIVYKTDAAISKKVRVAYEVPAADSPDISYPAAVLKESKSPEAAKKFLQYLASERAAKVFESFGFVVRK